MTRNICSCQYGMSLASFELTAYAVVVESGVYCSKHVFADGSLTNWARSNSILSNSNREMTWLYVHTNCGITFLTGATDNV